jgi:hypothetical protein
MEAPNGADLMEIKGRLPPEDSDISPGIELRSRYRL